MAVSEQGSSVPTNLLGIFCVIGAGAAFTTNDMAIKWLSGDYPLHQIILARSICGRLPVGKGFLDGDAVLVGAAICPAFECGALRWPLAIMLSADQVPVKSTQSRSCTG